jgi:hypothetical protein
MIYIVLQSLFVYIGIQIFIQHSKFSVHTKYTGKNLVFCILNLLVDPSLTLILNMCPT